jgi:DNA-directed RNA polymerase subunit M/transcription elongation factor TFIIS
MIGKIGKDLRTSFGCTVCKSKLRSIESIRRSDGNVLHLFTCNECGHKWKELWVQLHEKEIVPKLFDS